MKLLILASSFLLLLAPAGCAATAVLTRVALPVAALVPPVATAAANATVSFVAAPAQLGSFDGVQRNDKGEILPVNVRVPQDELDTRSLVSPEELPSLVWTDNYPRFDLRTVPTLPYGAFFVRIGNHSDHPITIGPTRVQLMANGHEVKAFPDSTSQLMRFSRIWSVVGDQAPRLGSPNLRSGISAEAFQRLAGPVTIQPGTIYEGYALFDTSAFTADEYNAFLQKAGSFDLLLTDGTRTLASVHFDAKMEPCAVLCLPETKQPSFQRCEAIATPR